MYELKKKILFTVVDLVFAKDDPISWLNLNPVGSIFCKTFCVWYDLIKYAILGGGFNSRCSLFYSLNQLWCPNDGWRGNCLHCHDVYLPKLPIRTELCYCNAHLNIKKKKKICLFTNFTEKFKPPTISYAILSRRHWQDPEVHDVEISSLNLIEFDAEPSLCASYVNFPSYHQVGKVLLAHLHKMIPNTILCSSEKLWHMYNFYLQVELNFVSLFFTYSCKCNCKYWLFKIFIWT